VRSRPFFRWSLKKGKGFMKAIQVKQVGAPEAMELGGVAV
jgi:hypothetical protein